MSAVGNVVNRRLPYSWEVPRLSIWMIFGAVELSSSLVRAQAKCRTAASIGEAALVVTLESGAESCPDAAELATKLEHWVDSTDNGAGLEMTVVIRATESGFAAEIIASGVTQGRRDLSAEGTDCRELERQLIASLSLLLAPRNDAELSPEPPPAEPAPAAPSGRSRASAPLPKVLATTGAASPIEAPERSAAFGDRASLAGQVFVGAGVTVGFDQQPLLWGAASFWLSRSAWALGVSAYATPSASAEYREGEVVTRFWGAIPQACYRLVDVTFASLKGCGAFALGALRAEGSGYVVEESVIRPWYAAGGSVLLRGPLNVSFDYSLEALLLVPLQHETFSVRNAGVAYETPPLGLGVLLGVGTSIW